MRERCSRGRSHHGRGDNRPCDFCRIRKARCLVKDSLPCEKCKRALRACTFNQDPPLRRRQQTNERDGAGVRSLIISLQPPILGPHTIGFGTPSPSAFDGGTVDFDFNWDFFQAHSTPNAFGLLLENSLSNKGFTSKPPSRPFLSDVTKSPTPPVFSLTHHIPAAEQIDIG